MEWVQSVFKNLHQNYPSFPKCQQKNLTGFIFLAFFKNAVFLSLTGFEILPNQLGFMTCLTRTTPLTIVKAISKMHLTLNNCVTPRSGIHADFIILRCIKSLLKMLTYFTYAALLRLSRHCPLILRRATADRLLIVELNNF